MEEVERDFVGRGVQDRGNNEMEGRCLMERLISSTSRSSPHCYLAASACPSNQGQCLEFPGDKGFSLPRHHESDTRVRVQGVPQHVAKKTKESNQGEN